MRASIFLSLLVSFVFSQPLSQRASGTTTYTSGSTASDVENGVCAPLTVIFARGTGEPGNIGYVIGPPLFAALSADLNKHVALQGVNYPADLNGDLDLGAEGAPHMIKMVRRALRQCPTTKIALSGYSQGGMVIHYALDYAGLSSGHVSSIVYFGDPGDGVSASGTVPAHKVKEYCAQGDGVCETHSYNVTAAHGSYGEDASAAAQFIIHHTGVSH